MSRRRQRLGRRAEARALSHLRRAGLELVARNWKASPRPGHGGHGGELDLIMQDGEVLVIVEVRAQKRGRDGQPFAGGAAYTVGPIKRRRIAQLAEIYLRNHKPRPRAVRFDVVALAKTGLLSWDIRWYKNAFSV